jgi:hypothetical protein
LTPSAVQASREAVLRERRDALAKVNRSRGLAAPPPLAKQPRGGGEEARRRPSDRPTLKGAVVVSLLAVKLIVTPLVVLAASLVGRRWGEALGGWIVGLPLTSGPVAAFLAVERGASFAAEASAGSLAGAVAQVAFVCGYALAAPWGWPAGLGGGAIAYVAAALALQAGALTPTTLFLVSLAALALGLAALPRGRRASAPSLAPWWEIPARMVFVTALVVTVTAFATTLGARASGVAASFPFIGAAFGVLAHRADGPQAGVAALRGMVAALFSFAFFFFTLGLALPRAGLLSAFAAATLVALVVQAATLTLVRGARRALVD